MDEEKDNDIINETLDLAPMPEEERNLPSIDITPEDGDCKVDADAEYARKNLYDIIEQGTRSMEELIEVASQSQHPRSYEVLATFMKNLVDVNKDLMELHVSKKKIKESKLGPAQGGKNNTQQNLFVGSADELLKFLEKKDDVADS